jgi:hypothetical protein
MNRLTKFSSAAFGMVLLAGLAFYQGSPELATGDNDALVGTAVIDSQEIEENYEELATEEAAETDCDPSQDPEDPNFEDCDKVSQK